MQERDIADRVTRLESILELRETARIERTADLERRLVAIDTTLMALRIDIQALTNRTRNHLVAATCLNAGKSALQWGGAGGGVVAVVVLLGKLLNLW